jgi:hypothetical protein
LRQVLNWEPEISLEEGLVRLYAWIEVQVHKKWLADGAKERALSVQAG